MQLPLVLHCKRYKNKASLYAASKTRLLLDRYQSLLVITQKEGLHPDNRGKLLGLMDDVISHEGGLLLSPSPCSRCEEISHCPE